MKCCNYKELCPSGIADVLDKATHCCLSLAQNNQPYVVPMDYTYKCEGCKYVFTLTSCPDADSMKIQYMRSNNKVCLCFNIACGNNKFKTVIAFGCAVLPCACNCAGKDKEIKFEVVVHDISGREYDCTPGCPAGCCQ